MKQIKLQKLQNSLRNKFLKLGVKMGAKRKTFYGLSGIGDLTLTCSSLKSRNTKFDRKRDILKFGAEQTYANPLDLENC